MVSVSAHVAQDTIRRCSVVCSHGPVSAHVNQDRVRGCSAKQTGD